MPWPVLTYQSPDGVMPAAFQMVSSLALVPESSPRVKKVDLVSAILVKASAATVMPLMPAGSLVGPTMMKSLYITACRSTPNPSAMYFSSAAGECTRRTSASPVSPILRASPLPTATTLVLYIG